nr:histidine kinase dimerization/phosphoacceptor domain-containing protein [Pseudonocardia sp. ICBG1142]
MLADRRPMWGPIARVLVPALVVGLFTAGGTAFTVARIARYPDPGTTALPLDVLAVVLLAAGPVALLFRHLDRVVALAVCAAAVVVYLGLGYPLMGPLGFAFAVALVSAVAAGHHHRALAVVVVAAAVLTGWLLVTGRPIPWPATAPVLAWLAALVAAGALWRVRRERTAQARRAAEAERRRSAAAERLRIAQELHDVLGHHVSLINVQAGVALYLMDDDPEQARTALTEIKRASRDLLREMRSTLGVLRGVDEQAPRAPTPRSGPARRAARRGARRGATGAARHRGDPAAVADGGRPGRVPDRAGVADQHASARGGGHRGGHAAVRRRRAGPDRRRRRCRPRPRRGGRHGADRHARACAFGRRDVGGGAGPGAGVPGARPPARTPGRPRRHRPHHR